MCREVNRVLENIEKRIRQCEILSQLLNDRVNNRNIDISKYRNMGYDEEQVIVGSELVDLYFILKQCVQERYKMNLIFSSVKK